MIEISAIEPAPPENLQKPANHFRIDSQYMNMRETCILLNVYVSSRVKSLLSDIQRDERINISVDATEARR